MQICTRCVMDTTDPEIRFDRNGVCSHCLNFEQNVRPRWHPGDEVGQRMLDEMVARIKETQKDKEYDAIIGISGGVDSSYLAYWATRLAGLRLLAVHVDAGWNSELAVQNIERIVRNLGIELYTHVVDWEAVRDVQLAFFRAGVANQDTPQDHAFFAALYQFATENQIKYVLHGSNLATESVLPFAWGHDPMDTDQITDICKRFGAPAFDRFPLVSFYRYYIYYPFIRRMKVMRPLDFMDYSKEKAIELLEKEFGWKYYGGKHYESRFTKFFQGYWLPQKFSFDKRKAHLSSMILSGQITRAEALEQLATPSYDEATWKQDAEFIAKKLEISVDEFLSLMSQPNRHFTDYKNNANKRKWYFRTTAILFRILHKVRSLRATLKI
ncbi:N-acetyl sugar amidotransferase [bacterium]|nr:N-acetyl sugar amidotransferase [bacterium]